MQIEKFSLGIGDRFGREGLAQLRALQQAEKAGVVVVPVWNKSFREHSLIGTTPDDVRAEADAAVRRGGWKHPYHVDADHIGVKTVDGFLAASDFYTLDVADFIGQAPDETALGAFVRDMGSFKGTLRIPGVDAPFEVTDAVLEKIGRSYLAAVMEAGKIYRHVAAAKGERNFIPEVSTDEATEPQLPFELFFILGALAREKISVQTIAPKFSGKFLRGSTTSATRRRSRASSTRISPSLSTPSRCSACRSRSRSASTPAATSSRSIRSSGAPSPSTAPASTSRPPGPPGSKK
jgi:hypothetical protein